MLTLIDTAIGFVLIMVLLSFLIKSLTSVVKNHVQYYTQNLRLEVHKLLKPLANVSVEKLEASFGGIDWRHVGEEILDPKNLRPLLQKIDPTLDLDDLDARVAVHKSALEYAFQKRMRNLSLACGLALCLLLNVNALTIWNTLYEDDQLRAKFSSDEYVAEVLQRGQETPEEPPAPAGAAGRADDAAGAGEDHGTPASEDPATAAGAAGEAEDAAARRAGLAEERGAWRQELEHFQDEVDFGIGAIWRQPGTRSFADALYELLGSLLTGVLTSVGAPYLHDLLRALASLRKQSANSPAESDGPR